MKLLLKLFLFITLLNSVLACENNLIPKPKAMLRLEYREPKYIDANLNCPFNFEINDFAKIEYNKNCNINIHYRTMKATFYLSYKKVNNDIEKLIKNTQKLTFEHTIKADNISSTDYIDNDKKVYGSLYLVKGNAASQAQFYVTDSIKNFVAGSIYFYATPNYDSILPASSYLEKDLIHIIETIKWKNK